MEKFKSFLIRRLILLLTIVVAAELLIVVVLNYIVFPLISFFMGQSELSSLSFGSLLLLIWGLIRGKDSVVLNTLETSIVVVLVLISFFLVSVPIVVGILIYARTVVREVELLEKERIAERKSYEAKRNLMLSDFAHDLRTPIMTISGYATAINDGVVKGDEQVKEYLNAIAVKSKRMAELISLLFEYVRVGSEGFELNRKKTDLHAFLTEIIAGVYPDLEEAGIDTDIDIPEEPFYISSDNPHLKRVIENLLINVIRHNPMGTKLGIIIKKASGVEYLAIADSGVAINKTEDEIFEPFVKGEDSRSKNTGSGLGLSVAKQLMDMHGYEIHLKQPYGDYTKAFILKFTESPS